MDTRGQDERAFAQYCQNMINSQQQKQNSALRNMNKTFFTNPTQFNSSADPMAETGQGSP